MMELRTSWTMLVASRVVPSVASLFRLLLIGVLVALPFRAHADVAIPPLKTRVTDTTSTLSKSQRESLEGMLEQFEKARGSQIAVLLVATTFPESIEQYSIRVADQWQLGRKGVDDGALLLVAKDDRTVRIEVGRGLEGVLTDLVSKRIIDQLIIPQFRSGDIYAGLNSGLDAILRVVSGESLPAPTPQSPSSDIVPLLVVGCLMLSGVLTTLLGRLWGSLLLGVIASLAALFFVSIFVALLIGLLAFMLSILGIMAPARRYSGGRSRYGGYSSGGSWGGGGGFSGGGGGFSGGGASGRW